MRQLAAFPPAEGMALRFQAAFDILETDLSDDAALEWVFRVAGGQRAALDLRSLPEDTVLQRRMKADLLAGGKPGCALGRLRSPERRPFR